MNTQHKFVRVFSCKVESVVKLRGIAKVCSYFQMIDYNYWFNEVKENWSKAFLRKSDKKCDVIMSLQKKKFRMFKCLKWVTK